MSILSIENYFPLRGEHVTSEQGFPLVTVLDGQQLDEAAGVVVLQSLCMTEGLQNAVNLHFIFLNQRKY